MYSACISIYLIHLRDLCFLTDGAFLCVCVCVCVCVCTWSLCHVQLSATSWTVACQTPLPMGILQGKYWSGLPSSPPEDLPNSGIKHRLPA